MLGANGEPQSMVSIAIKETIGNLLPRKKHTWCNVKKRKRNYDWGPQWLIKGEAVFGTHPSP